MCCVVFVHSLSSFELGKFSIWVSVSVFGITGIRGVSVSVFGITGIVCGRMFSRG